MEAPKGRRRWAGRPATSQHGQPACQPALLRGAALGAGCCAGGWLAGGRAAAAGGALTRLLMSTEPWPQYWEGHMSTTMTTVQPPAPHTLRHLPHDPPYWAPFMAA